LGIRDSHKPCIINTRISIYNSVVIITLFLLRSK